MADPYSIAGRSLPIEERTQLLVIGAGAAGLACAMAAAGDGQSVVLVDENPVAAATMGDDVPQMFGGRAGAATRNPRAMMEAFANAPGIVAAFESGVDVRLATACLGVYAPGPSLGWLSGPVATLTDGARSWMIAADRIVAATGRRDMGLAFPGWDLPGIMGATAACQLATRYGALDSSRAVILGTTAEALDAGLILRRAGVTIAAVIEQAETPIFPVAELLEGGATLLCGHVLRRAEGRDGVTAAVAVDGTGRLTRIECDSIVLGIGVVPLIELLDSAGCRTVFDAARGGTVPVLDGAGRTSVPGILAAGDCAGIWPAKSLDDSIAAEEGRACALGSSAPASSSTDWGLAAYRLAWVRASVVDADGAPFVCRCEEVTAREILEVRPPRYLNAPDDRRNDRSLSALLGEGPPSPDQVKRLTRAGMGLCQGRRCREQMACLLALGAGVDLAEIPPATHRAPVRPVALSVAAAATQPDQHWDTWFGMPAQYRPVGEEILPYTVAARDL